MIRQQLKHFNEYADAKGYVESLEGEHYQIRRRRHGFDVVKRLQGISKWSDIKATKGSTNYTKKKKRKRYEPI